MLEFYLGSIIGSLAVDYISSAAISRSLKRKGYGFNKKKLSFVEKFCSVLKFILMNCIPIFNIVGALTLLNMATSEKGQEKAIKILLDRKLTYKTEELLAQEEKEKIASIDNEEIKECLNTKDADINNKYSVMSDAEKLAFLKEERDTILGANKVEEPNFQKVNKRKNDSK